VDPSAYKIFATLERTHWWFQGRRGLYLPLLSRVLEQDRGGPPTDLRVLDMGCGTGGFLPALERYGTVTGMEMEEGALAWCREKGATRLAAGRGDALPVPDGRMDLMCLFDVIEHAPDDAQVLAEARRVLAPGGHLAVSVPAYQWLYSHNDRVAHHFRRYTRGELVRKLRAAGLEVRRATYVNVILGMGIIPTVLLIKAKEKLLGVGNPDTNNLTYPVPGAVNGMLARVFAGERHLLRHVSAPFGHSLFAVARRPADGAP
jgi:SAM-dependent methyltransferase